MALYDIFHNAADTIFNVFKSLTHQAVYVSKFEDGFDVVTTTELDIDIIIDTFSERDVQFLSFSQLIQPTDVKGLVRGKQLTSIELSTNDLVRVDGTEYTVVAYSTDPATAVYTLLLRAV